MEPIKQETTVENVYTSDIRICEVISCEKMPKKDRLLILQVNTGIDNRTIVTNIGSQYTPEELVGKRMPFILNLPPHTFGGVISNGMIMCITNGTKIELITSTAEIGSVIF